MVYLRCLVVLCAGGARRGAGAERRITNVAAGTSSTDAATYGQLTALQQQLTKQNTLLRSSTLPGATSTPVTDYIAVSPIVTTGGDGTHVDTTKTDAMAIGPVSSAIGNESLAIGAGAFAAQDGSTAIGYIAAAGAVNTTVIGAQASTTVARGGRWCAMSEEPFCVG